MLESHVKSNRAGDTIPVTPGPKVSRCVYGYIRMVTPAVGIGTRTESKSCWTSAILANLVVLVVMPLTGLMDGQKKPTK
jgi:hypothetical protein